MQAPVTKNVHADTRRTVSIMETIMGTRITATTENADHTEMITATTAIAEIMDITEITTAWRITTRTKVTPLTSAGRIIATTTTNRLALPRSIKATTEPMMFVEVLQPRGASADGLASLNLFLSAARGTRLRVPSPVVAFHA